MSRVRQAGGVGRSRSAYARAGGWLVPVAASTAACLGVAAWFGSSACTSSTPAVPGGDAGVASRPLDCTGDSGDAGAGHDSWPLYGGDICNSRSSTTAALTTGNVGSLALKWKMTTAGDISATPLVSGGRIYVPDWSGSMYCIDAASHAVVWSRTVSDILGIDAGLAPPDDAGNGSFGSRSTTVAVSRGTPVIAGNLLVFGVATSPALMVAVDKDTGALAWQTTVDDNPYALVAASPVIDQGVLYVGVSSSEEGAALSDPNHAYTFRGSVVALDPASGRIVWTAPMIDDSVYFNQDGTRSGYAGAAVWSGTPTIDRRRKQLYVTTGNNYSVSPALPDGGALPAGDHVESIVALDMATGKVRWAQRMTAGDIWNFALIGNPDYDFGCGANLFQATISGAVHDIVGAGQKSGVYWALDADTGEILWHTVVGPGGHLGGIHWGTATDGQRIYVGVNDETGTDYPVAVAPDAGGDAAAPPGTHKCDAGVCTQVGSWAALDPATGRILWQVPNPTMTAPVGGASVNGPVTVVNGVVLAGSMDAMGTLLAFEASTGRQLWSFASGATVYGAPAIAGGVVYWGNGYPVRLTFGTPGNTLFAFAVP
ncbi:MAG: PQQ-binding-like beta-propeller repeat protein [Polyangiaceae bacterium]